MAGKQPGTMEKRLKKKEPEKRQGAGRYSGLLLAARFLVSGGLLYLIITTVPFGEVVDAVGRANAPLLVSAFLLLLARTPLMAWRWRLLLAGENQVPSLNLLSNYYFQGFFYNNFLPTSIGGDLSRALNVIKKGVPRSIAIASILLERFLGMLALVMIGAVSFYFLGTPGEIAHPVVRSLGFTLGVSVLLLGLAVLVLLSLQKFFLKRTSRDDRADTWLQKGIAMLCIYRERKNTLGLVILLTIISQLSAVLVMYLIALSLQAGFPFLYFSLFMPVVWLASMLPVSLSGLGVREGAFVYLFGLVGMADRTAVAIALIWLCFTYGLSLIGGMYLFFPVRVKNEGTPG